MGTTFDVSRTTQYWVESAGYDLAAPYTHSLTLLASKTDIPIPESTLDRLAEYTEFHLESRYPDEKKEFYEKCTEQFAQEKFREMEDLHKWLMQKLEE